MRPVELIVVNTMYDVAEKLHALPEQARGQFDDHVVSESLARDILLRIAQSARPEVVLKALAACGAPGDRAEILAQFQVVKENSGRR